MGVKDTIFQDIASFYDQILFLYPECFLWIVWLFTELRYAQSVGIGEELVGSSGTVWADARRWMAAAGFYSEYFIDSIPAGFHADRFSVFVFARFPPLGFQSV